jgi:hypothetical protein
LGMAECVSTLLCERRSVLATEICEVILFVASILSETREVGCTSAPTIELLVMDIKVWKVLYRGKQMRLTFRQGRLRHV